MKKIKLLAHWNGPIYHSIPKKDLSTIRSWSLLWGICFIIIGLWFYPLNAFFTCGMIILSIYWISQGLYIELKLKNVEYGFTSITFSDVSAEDLLTICERLLKKNKIEYQIRELSHDTHKESGLYLTETSISIISYTHNKRNILVILNISKEYYQDGVQLHIELDKVFISKDLEGRNIRNVETVYMSRNGVYSLE